MLNDLVLRTPVRRTMAGACLVLTLATAAAPAQAQVEGPRTEHRVRRGLIIGGLFVWSHGYTASLVWAVDLGVGGGGCFDDAAAVRAIPLVGPFVFPALVSQGCGPLLTLTDAQVQRAWAFGLIEGVIQLAGFALLLVGIAGTDVEVAVGDTTLRPWAGAPLGVELSF